MKKYSIVSIVILIIMLIIGFTILNTFKPKKEINSISLLEYGYGDGRMINGDVLYKLECDDKCLLFSKLEKYSDDEVFTTEISKDDYSKILKTLQDNNVSSWDGFNKSNKHVLDGTSYHFKVVTNDNVTVFASGYMKYPKHFKETINKILDIFDKANDKIFFKLLDHDNYKNFNIDNITKVIDDFYGEGGVDTKEYTNKKDIENLYQRFNQYELGIETKMSCEDNTHIYKFIMNNGKEYIIEEECNMIVLNNKRYIPRYIKK